MTTVNIPATCRVALKTSAWISNTDRYPDANVQSFLAEETNRICRWDTKAAEFSVPASSIPAGASGSTTMWRFVVRSSPFARYFHVVFEMTKSGLDGTLHDPSGKVLCELSDGTDVGTAEFHYGANPGAADNFYEPSNWGTGYATISSAGSKVTLTANTDYYFTVSAEDHGRIVGVAVYEEMLASDTDNGYLNSGVTAGGPIYDADTSAMVPLLRAAWKNGCGLWHWASHTDALAPTRTSGTRANWIDQTITGVGNPATSEPGVGLYLANKSTERRVTVPCKLFVFAKMSTGAVTGHVYLHSADSGEAVDISVTSATAAWYTATVDLAANDTNRYVLRIMGDNINTLTLYAATLIQYEA